jgi:hypothetical protein
MGMDKHFRIYVGTTVPAEDFDLVDPPSLLDGKQDGELCATRGFELQHEEVVVGIPVATFSHRSRDLQGLHSLDLRKRFEDVAPKAKKQLRELGINGDVSIYTVTEVL